MDTGHGIITGVDCYPANRRESDIILEHLKGQPCKYQEIGLDGGYDMCPDLWHMRKNSDIFYIAFLNDCIIGNSSALTFY